MRDTLFAKMAYEATITMALTVDPQPGQSRPAEPQFLGKASADIGGGTASHAPAPHNHAPPRPPRRTGCGSGRDDSPENVFSGDWNEGAGQRAGLGRIRSRIQAT